VVDALGGGPGSFDALSRLGGGPGSRLMGDGNTTVATGASVGATGDGARGEARAAVVAAVLLGDENDVVVAAAVLAGDGAPNGFGLRATAGTAGDWAGRDRNGLSSWRSSTAM
jgi:hypothetical protein